MSFCNVGHPAIAFIGATCPACVFRSAPGATLGTSSVEELKGHLRLILALYPDSCERCSSKGFEKSVTGVGCTFCDGTEGGNPPTFKEK